MRKTAGNKPKNLRKNNIRIIFNFFREHDFVSASDITSNVQLSKPTVMKIIDFLESEKLILNIGKGTSSEGGGRKPNLYKFNSTYRYSIVFHIFPDELLGTITDLSGNIIKTISKPIDFNTKFEELVRFIEDSVKILLTDLAEIDMLTGIAVGAHGVTNAETGVIFYSPHFPKWGKYAALKDRLHDIFGKEINIQVDNQIRYQVLSEKKQTRDFSNIIVIEAGVGLVAGILVNNNVKRGAHFLAGEIGHIPLDPNGEQCVCGANGCFEAMVQIQRIINRAISGYETHTDSRIFSKSKPENIKIYDIFSAALNDDAFAQELVCEAASWFARGIITIQLMYDPDCVIIQGIYSHAGKYLINCIKQQIKEMSPLIRDHDIEIRLSSLGKTRGIIGAAWKLTEDYLEKLQF